MDIEHKLRQSEYFASLHPEQVKALLGKATLCRFDSGEMIVRQSDADDWVFFILAGRTEVLVAQVGDEHSLEMIATIGAGEIVGERALLGLPRRSATVRAKDPIVALKWDASELHELLIREGAIGATVMTTLARKLSDRLVAANNNLRNALAAQAML